jgi:hypothetical protein
VFDYVIWMVVAVLVALGIWKAVTIWRADEERRKRQWAKWAAADAEINSLPLEEVKRRALSLLNDPEVFTTVQTAGDANNDKLKGLPPLVREVLTAYDLLQAPDMMEFTPGIIEPHPSDNAFITIADAGESSLLVKPPEETVYVLIEGFRIDEITANDTYPTIYHWILDQDPKLYDD